MRSLLFSLCLLATSGLQAQTLQIAGSVWPPFVGNELPDQGVAVKIVREALKRAGYESEVTIENLPRILDGAKAGIYDVLPTVWYSDERAEFLEYSKPFYVNDIKFMKRKGVPIRFDGDYRSLKGLRIGIVNDYAYGKDFSRARGFVRYVNNHVLQNILLLQSGQIDLLAADEYVARHEINRFMGGAIEQFEFLPVSVTQRNMHIGVSKANPDHKEIVAKFNVVIEKMRNSGEIRRMANDYFDSYNK